ncbi:Amidase [Mycobacterium sp. 012931]|nr:Amidase [Mycobacterium sp. 012931]MBC9862255.1 putative amidase [Mycobacterium pseudoshottsii]
MDPSDLAFAGAAAQARMLADGEVTAPMLLEVYLERIERLDSELRAYRVVRYDAAREEAEVAQQRLDAGERLPLLGVPIAIKDDVDVAGEVTTYGSAGMARRRAPTRKWCGGCGQRVRSSSARPMCPS